MKDFIKENWIWLAAPFVVAAVIIVALLFLGGGEEGSPFVYSIF